MNKSILSLFLYFLGIAATAGVYSIVFAVLWFLTSAEALRIMVLDLFLTISFAFAIFFKIEEIIGEN